jgi:hypothetical protein
MDNLFYKSEKTNLNFEAEKVKRLIEENLKDLQNLNLNKDEVSNR